MSRMLPSVWMLFLCAGVFHGLRAECAAQDRPAGTRSLAPRGTAPGARPAAGVRPAAGEAVAPRAAGPVENGGDDARPDGQPLRIEPLPKDLEDVLNAWERASAKITILEGDHRRYEYDKVFFVESRSEGTVYYVSPDKGKIVMTPSSIKKGEVSKRLSPDGKPYKLQGGKSEKWICTGQEIIKANVDEKTIEAFPIPPQHQGANIMEGPLPFLFGMPAEKAKMRYEMTLLKNDQSVAWIRAKPRWKSDAEQYREATIILDKQNERYLPSAVQLIDPSGNTETVYSFDGLKVNPRAKFFGGDPLAEKFDRKDGWKWIEPPKVAEAQPLLPDATPNTRPRAPAGNGIGPARRDVAPSAIPQAEPGTVPHVVGFHYKDAEQKLKALGYNVKFRRGVPATDAKQTYVVYDQEPKFRTPLAKGQDIILTLYDMAAEAPPAAGK